MLPFSLQVAPGRQVEGLVSLPDNNNISTQKYKPLIITVHGGTYTGKYFDATPSTSIEAVSAPLGLPVVSLNRPGYGASTPLPPLATGQTFMQETAKLLHDIILPALWNEFGARATATAIVLHSHSIGTAISIMVAALHARADGGAAYPLAGLVAAGLGSQLRPPGKELGAIIAGWVPGGPWPSEIKDELMLRRSLGLTDPTTRDVTGALNQPFSLAEQEDVVMSWKGYWRAYAADVRVPVLYGLPDQDGLWDSAPGRVEEFLATFERSRGVQGAILLAAPHSVELSWQGRAWFTKSCAFAMECAMAKGLQGW